MAGLCSFLNSLLTKRLASTSGRQFENFQTSPRCEHCGCRAAMASRRGVVLIELTRSLDRYRAIRRQASTIRLVSDRSGASAADADPQCRPAVSPRRLRQPVRGPRLCGPWRDRPQFLRCPRPPAEQPALSRAARAGAKLRPPPDRRRRGARPAARAGGRHLAGLLRGLLRRAVCRGLAGARRGSGRSRRQGKLHRAASPADRRRRRGRHRGARRPRRLCHAAARGTTAALLAGTMARFEALPEAPVELRPLSAPANSATCNSPRAARACRSASTSARTS